MFLCDVLAIVRGFSFSTLNSECVFLCNVLATVRGIPFSSMLVIVYVFSIKKNYRVVTVLIIMTERNNFLSVNISPIHCYKSG